MKKAAALLVFCFLLFSSQAQITITSANMPGSGDTARYSEISLFDSLDFISTGANYTWDFSYFTPINQGLYEYKAISQINPVYFAFFGFSSFGQKIMDSLDIAGVITVYDIYDFYSGNSTSFKAVGRGMEFQGLPVPSDYSDNDEIYQFPLNYGDVDSSTWAVSFQLDTILQYHQSGTRLNEVEGWGTIMTPYDTVSCLKVKSTITEHDSLVISGFGLPAIDRVRYEYKWLSLTEFVPMLQVNAEDIFGFPVVNSIRYRDNYRANVGISENSAGTFSLYPNPVSDGGLNVIMPVPVKNLHYTVYSASGQLLANEQVNSTGNFMVDTQTLPAGLYLLRLSGENYISTQLFIKK